MTKITITSRTAWEFDLEEERLHGNNKRCDYHCGNVHLICSEDDVFLHPESDTVDVEVMNGLLESIEIANVHIKA